jgi:hypothetical protein
MVQEIERRKTELRALAFGDLEILLQPQVAVKESRSIDVGPHNRAVDPERRGKGETIGVEVVARKQFFPSYQPLANPRRSRSPCTQLGRLMT